MRTFDQISGEVPGRFEYESSAPRELDRAAFAMGCFWGVEAGFAAIEGVYRTAVGYTGGEKSEPTYRSLGEHSETVMVGFDPEEVSYGDLLEHFFKAHDYTSRRKPQYASKVFPVTAGQEEEARRALKSRQDAATTVQELETFWVAEDYHQKYRLRQFNQLMALFSDHSPEQFINSPLAAKLNAISAGKNIEVDSLELPEEHRETVEKHVQSYV